MPQRHPDWLDRLQAYVDGVRAAPYDYAQNNCGHFAAGAVMAMTGQDPLATLAIDSGTLRDWARLVHQGGGLVAIASRYGGELVPPLQLRRGDIAVRDGDGGDTLGVCMGDHVLFVGPAGLQSRKLTECRGGWRIG